MMHIVIAEDEGTVARRIARLTAEILAVAPRFSFARNVSEARAALKSANPDLLILDLNLEGEEGFELLRDASCESFETIVISAHTDRALDAFDYGVRDFVPKPFGRERLERALHRVIGSLSPEQPLRYLGVRLCGGTHLVPVEEILFIEGAGARAELVLRNGQRLSHSRNLERLETVLPSHFERIHKSFIADVRQIARLEARPGSRYSVVLTDGTVLPVGRTRVRKLRKRFAS